LEQVYEALPGRTESLLPAFPSVISKHTDDSYSSFTTPVRQPRLEEIDDPKKLIFWLARNVMRTESPKLRKQARLTSVSTLRRLKKAPPRSLRLWHADNSSEDVITQTSAHIEALPAKELQVFALHRFEHLTVPEYRQNRDQSSHS